MTDLNDAESDGSNIVTTTAFGAPGGTYVLEDPEKRWMRSHKKAVAPATAKTMFCSLPRRKKLDRVLREVTYGGGCDVFRGGNAKCILLDVCDVVSCRCQELCVC